MEQFWGTLSVEHWIVLAVCGAILGAAAMYRIVFRVLWKGGRERYGGFARTALKHWGAPASLLIPLLVLRTLLPPDGATWVASVKNGLSLVLIATVAWILMRTATLGEALVLARYRLDVADNLHARKIHTQIRFIKRIFFILVVVVAAASMLMVFERLRQMGASLLASAGIVGMVIGLAAQRSIANLLVGLQIAFTQPIRLDDVVIVENEWGRIEEITSTYAVVRLWDLRRLIVPLTYFTEKPFQNWTRVSADLLGTVFLYVDYAVRVEAVRSELHEILKQSKLWDGKVWNLQVTDSKPQGMELRALMSAANASAAWDLRCQVRERLVTFLQERYPESFPKLRAELKQR